MGYFSNGTEGEAYEEEYCDKCVHQEDQDGNGCSVWFAHLLYNYKAAGKDANLEFSRPCAKMVLKNANSR